MLVFVDYLVKCVEACPASNETSETIAQLLVDNIICCYEVPEELILDCDAYLLSVLIKELCEVCGMKKINTILSYYY